MIQARRWTVEIFVGQVDGLTYAEAALCDDAGNRTRGRGQVRSDPLHSGAQLISEIAVSRALHDLSLRLVDQGGAEGRVEEAQVSGAAR